VDEVSPVDLILSEWDSVFRHEGDAVDGNLGCSPPENARHVSNGHVGFLILTSIRRRIKKVESPHIEMARSGILGSENGPNLRPLRPALAKLMKTVDEING